MKLRIILILSLLFTCTARLAIGAEAPAVDPSTTLPADDEQRFLRFVGDAKNGGKLVTADVVYKNDKGVTVRLISAVHIGEAAYFKSIQKTLADTDAALYEMVKPKDAGPPVQGERSDSGISQLQNFL